MRVQRTFAFLDLCGFTAFTNTRGDADAVAVLAQLRAIVRVEAEHHGVRVTKWLGDGAMLSGIDAPPVFECCVAIRDRITDTLPLAVRGGICSGPVIMFEGDDYIGAPVNVAARLCDEADAGVLLATAETAEGAEIAVVPAGVVGLSGFEAPIDVVALPGASASVGALTDGAAPGP